MVPGLSQRIWALEIIPGIMSTERGSPRTKKYMFFNRSGGWNPRIYTSDIYWVELKEYLPESHR
jgi:hypothetical protein